MEDEDQRNGRRVRRETPYRQWQAGEGLPVSTGSAVADLHTLAVSPWSRMGQKGAFVSLGDQERGDGYVLEIAPGGQTEVQHHLFEVSLYVLDGRGATAVWQAEGGRKQTVEWQRGSVYSPPLNCFYQHFNLDGQAPARLFALDTAPTMMNVFRNPDFIFNDPSVFADRYNAEDDYFTDPGQHLGWRRWKTNFIPDIRAFKLDDYKQRGAGGTNMHFSLSNNAMGGHVSDFPPGTYKKAHWHGVGPHLIILNGQGYSLFWFRGQERRKVDWKDGTIVVPRAGEYHQHFNTGATNARYLVFGFGGGGGRVRDSDEDAPPPTAVSEREGGRQIEYEDEDPAIYDQFVEECRRHSAQVRLPRPAYRDAAAV